MKRTAANSLNAGHHTIIDNPIRIVESTMKTDRDKGVDAATAILGKTNEQLEEKRRLEEDREWDVNQATAALRAISALCTTYSLAAQDEALDCVGRSDMAALLNLISDRLERSAI